MDRIFLTVNEISALIAVHLERLLLYQLINPSTPRSDEHETSPYNIHTVSSKQVVRIFKLI